MSKDFLEIDRIKNIYRPVDERISDYNEVERDITTEEINQQAKRCMSCGIPFCHGSGCPLMNAIPEMNNRVYANDIENAWLLLNATSPMPEFTSRVCPALCENSCTASLATEPVMVRQIEKFIVESAFAKNLVKADIPQQRSGKKVAVVGSGPAGLAMAIKLNEKGHRVTIYEKQPQAGGLLRYGIPSFKLEKSVIDRRVKLMEASGITFVYNAKIGEDISYDYLTKNFDAVVIALGTPNPRDLKIENRELNGVYFALDFLNGKVSAKDKNVVIIGGGDTSSDCVGMSIRQGAKSALQIEIMPEPPVERSSSTPWPTWAYKLRTSSSQYEGGSRRWNLLSKKFLGENGKINGVEVETIKWDFSPAGRPEKFNAVANSSEILKADIVLLAMGFLKNEFDFNNEKIFVAGDAANGPSLVVRAIADALKIAKNVDEFLKG